QPSPGREPRRTRPPAALVLGALRATRATPLGCGARALLQGNAGDGPRPAQAQPPAARAARRAAGQRVATVRGRRLSRRITLRNRTSGLLIAGYTPSRLLSRGAPSGRP